MNRGTAPSSHSSPAGPIVLAGRSPRAIVLFAGAFVLLLGSDLLFKEWAFDHVPQGGTITVVPNILSLHLTMNEGAVFGVLRGQWWFFVGASIAAAGFIVFFFASSRAREWPVHLALALIFGGAMGNLYDRIVHQAVRDMLWLFPNVKLPFGWSWWGGSDELYPWIFNLADVYLLIGIGVILLRSLFVTTPSHPPPPA